MADTGYNWDASWSAMKKGGGNDWTADAIADTSTETGDAFSLDNKAAAEISIAALSQGSVLDDDVVTVYVLGDIDGTNFEDTVNGQPFTFTFVPVQSVNVYIRFRLLGSDFSKIKLALKNDMGQSINFTVKYKYATIPVAS